MDKLASYLKKLVKWEEALEKRREGFRVGVLHMHSSYSRDVPNLVKNMPDILVCKALREGADYIAVTDHDTDDAWRRTSYHHPCWIRGVEMEVFDKSIGYPIHLGILNIRDNELFDYLWHIAHRQHDAFHLVEMALQNGATVIGNHPWWGAQGYRVNSIGFWDLMETFRLPVELNSKRSLIENAATLIYAAQRQLPIVSTTDSHTRKMLPICTLAKGDTVEEFLAGIRRGETCVVPGYAGFIEVPAMMATYVVDVIHAHLYNGFRKSLPDLSAGNFVNSLLAGITSSRMKNRKFNRLVTSAVAGAVTYTGSALCYIPYSYANSVIKVLRDLYQRSGRSMPLTELMSE